MLKAVEKQQQRGCYWTLIAPPKHTIWSAPGIGRFLSNIHMFVGFAGLTPVLMLARERLVMPR